MRSMRFSRWVPLRLGSFQAPEAILLRTRRSGLDEATGGTWRWRLEATLRLKPLRSIAAHHSKGYLVRVGAGSGRVALAW